MSASFQASMGSLLRISTIRPRPTSSPACWAIPSGTADPGAPGTTVVAGHRDTHFAFLRDLRAGDPLELEDRLGRVHRYEVVETAIVHARDARVARHNSIVVVAADRAGREARVRRADCIDDEARGASGAVGCQAETDRFAVEVRARVFPLRERLGVETLLGSVQQRGHCEVAPLT